MVGDNFARCIWTGIEIKKRSSVENWAVGKLKVLKAIVRVLSVLPPEEEEEHEDDEEQEDEWSYV